MSFVSTCFTNVELAMLFLYGHISCSVFLHNPHEGCLDTILADLLREELILLNITSSIKVKLEKRETLCF